MKTYALAAVLALAVSPALASNWSLSKRVDPMTDRTVCMVTSTDLQLSFTKNGSDPFRVWVNSAYTRHGLTVRVDKHEAVYLGHNAYDYGPKLANEVIPQLEGAERLLVQYSDYPEAQQRETAVANLPQLLAECGT